MGVGLLPPTPQNSVVSPASSCWGWKTPLSLVFPGVLSAREQGLRAGHEFELMEEDIEYIQEWSLCWEGSQSPALPLLHPQKPRRRFRTRCARPPKTPALPPLTLIPLGIVPPHPCLWLLDQEAQTPRSPPDSAPPQSQSVPCALWSLLAFFCLRWKETSFEELSLLLLTLSSSRSQDTTFSCLFSSLIGCSFSECFYLIPFCLPNSQYLHAPGLVIGLLQLYLLPLKSHQMSWL